MSHSTHLTAVVKLNCKAGKRKGEFGRSATTLLLFKGGVRTGALKERKVGFTCRTRVASLYRDSLKKGITGCKPENKRPTRVSQLMQQFWVVL